MSLLITPTLIDSYEWYRNSPPSWKERSFVDFKNKLGRAKWEPNEAIKRGMLFEDTVNKNCNRPGIDEFNSTQIFKDVCHTVKNAEQQKKFKKIMQIDDKEFLLYGKADYVFKDKIIDLKTTKDYKGKDKYLKGWQHIIYTAISKIKEFEYLIVEWNDCSLPGELFTIKYTMNDIEENNISIREKIKEIMSFIESDDKMSKMYYNDFNMF